MMWLVTALGIPFVQNTRPVRQPLCSGERISDLLEVRMQSSELDSEFPHCRAATTFVVYLLTQLTLHREHAALFGQYDWELGATILANGFVSGAANNFAAQFENDLKFGLGGHPPPPGWGVPSTTYQNSHGSHTYTG